MEPNMNTPVADTPVIDTPVAETVTAPAVAPAQTIEVPATIPAPAESNEISAVGIIATAAAGGAILYGAKKLFDKVVEPGIEKLAMGFLRHMDRKRAKKAYEQAATAAAEPVVCEPVVETPITDTVEAAPAAPNPTIVEADK